MEFDLETAERQMEAEALRQGIDLDALSEAAGRHFQSGELKPVPPATDDEIQQMVDDEMEFLRLGGPFAF